MNPFLLLSLFLVLSVPAQAMKFQNFSEGEVMFSFLPASLNMPSVRVAPNTSQKIEIQPYITKIQTLVGETGENQILAFAVSYTREPQKKWLAEKPIFIKSTTDVLLFDNLALFFNGKALQIEPFMTYMTQF